MVERRSGVRPKHAPQTSASKKLKGLTLHKLHLPFPVQPRKDLAGLCPPLPCQLCFQATGLTRWPSESGTQSLPGCVCVCVCVQISWGSRKAKPCKNPPVHILFPPPSPWIRLPTVTLQKCGHLGTYQLPPFSRLQIEAAALFNQTKRGPARPPRADAERRPLLLGGSGRKV